VSTATVSECSVDALLRVDPDVSANAHLLDTVAGLERARRMIDGAYARMVAEVEHRGLAAEQGAPRRRRCCGPGSCCARRPPARWSGSGPPWPSATG
jgi:hypothetical protein